MARRSSAPGKIILSGEYAVLFGKRAIAVPSAERLSVSFTPQRTGGTVVAWEGADPRWIEYAKRILLELEKASGHMHGSVVITGNLPLGKGMGSSTALVVATARCLLGHDCEAAARNVEDTVNPGHSGLDFAVIWQELPMLFQRGKKPEAMELMRDIIAGATFLDTGTPNETTPELVKWIRSREKALRSPIETIGECTERLLRAEPLKEVMRDHHRAQVALGVVPKSVQETIAAIEKHGGSAKVLGAGARTGGGGMVLVIG
jgi:mevalonate kinase